MNAPLDELVTRLGLPAALRLVEHFGGTRIYLPRAEAMNADHPIALVVGLEAAIDLCKTWPQERPAIPRAAAFLRNERDRALLKDANDHTVPALARKYELTERQVYYILARGLSSADEPELAAQSKLF